MSEIKIRRRSRQVSITLHAATENSATLRLEDFAGGVLDVGTMATAATTLQMYAASSEAGAFRLLRKSDGNAVEVTLSPSTASGRVYALPDEVYAVPFLKIVAGSTAASGVQGIVTLKS